MDAEEAIYEAAENTGICTNPKWPLLKRFFARKGVKQAEIDAKTPSEWMEMLDTAIKEVNAMNKCAAEIEAKKLMKQEEGAERELGDRSMDSSRESDSDSGIHFQESVQ